MPDTNKQSEFFERPLMTAWLDEAGILHVVLKNTRRTKSNLEADHNFLLGLTQNKKVCALIDVTHTGSFDTERIKFTKKEMQVLYKAVAIVAKTEAGLLGGSIVSALNPLGIPMKIFSCNKEAVDWLKRYYQESFRNPERVGRHHLPSFICLRSNS